MRLWGGITCQPIQMMTTQVVMQRVMKAGKLNAADDDETKVWRLPFICHFMRISSPGLLVLANSTCGNWHSELPWKWLSYTSTYRLNWNIHVYNQWPGCDTFIPMTSMVWDGEAGVIRSVHTPRYLLCDAMVPGGDSTSTAIYCRSSRVSKGLSHATG